MVGLEYSIPDLNVIYLQWTKQTGKTTRRQVLFFCKRIAKRSASDHDFEKVMSRRFFIAQNEEKFFRPDKQKGLRMTIRPPEKRKEKSIWIMKVLKSSSLQM